MLKIRTADHWLVLGTWVLAIATIALALDARWSSDRQIRAYVYVNPDVLFHADGKGTLQVYTGIGNSGQTPAINVQRYAGLEVLPPTENPLATQPLIREIGVTILGPRTEIFLIKNWAQGALKPNQSQKIHDGTLRVYLFGKALYDDILGDEWELDFCNAYFGGEQAPNKEGNDISYGYTGWQSKPCEKGNETKERQPEIHRRYPPK